ncbi:MAG TPA: bifunctional riboflavin kinase/FAD synthetase [Usitatibacteraceae bacterium]|nr:bifunctional riboflavin kinase/FAD synthetase [Usitatibacteraceae bacterium]
MPLTVIRDPKPGAPDAVVAIGSFDGVHLGHRALLARVVDEARQLGAVPAVLTFEPLPRELLFPDRAPPRISTLSAKLHAFAEAGIGIAYVCRFTREFAALSPEDFARRLRELHGARRVLVGKDFRFGARRAGDVAFLAAQGARLGFEVETLATVADGDERVSSTRVREALAGGDLALAARLLGRPYAICGRVVHGAKLGRNLGYPTANIALPPGRPVMTGVFAVKCAGAATRGLEGVASLGYKPVVARNGPPTLEAYLFDFSGDLYGRRLSIEFLKKLRDEANYASLDELVAQIRLDCDAARAHFRGKRGPDG